MLARKHRFLIGSAAFGLACALLGGCPQQQPDPDDSGGIPANARLKAFSSREEWGRYFNAQVQRQRNLTRSTSLFPLFAEDAATGGLNAAPQAMDDGGGDGSAGGGVAFSTTNLQEAGVDEADLFKSDGTFFYIVKDNSLRIVRAAPRDQLAEVGRLDIDDFVREIYLIGDRVLLLAQRYNRGQYSSRPGPAIDLAIWPPYYVSSDLVLHEVNVADRAAPAIVRTAELDGSLVSSRLLNGRLILVLAIAPEIPQDALGGLFAAIAIDEVMPRKRIDGAESELVPWDRWLYPESPDGYNMTAVVTLDAADIGNQLASVAVLAGASTIYSSTEALYVTNASYDPNQNYREFTDIHKFAYDDDGVARYVASGQIKGRLLNQFSLGEHNGSLRVASHVTNPWVFTGGGDIAFVDGPDGSVATSPRAQAADAPAAPFNAVYVLQQADAALNVVGQVENLAPTETIYSVRFLANRGYVVTFRQIDPLFVLDLADPANPSVLGELKIPGFSEYLHPVGENHLIGLGKATSIAAWGGVVADTVQLSLFDVSNPAAPTVVEQIQLGGRGSTTEAGYNQKAFVYMPESGTLAIPGQLYPINFNPYVYDPSGTPDVFVGTLFFDVDTATGFSELGRIAAIRSDASYWYYPQWMRPALIGEVGYAVTSDGVAAAPLADFASRTTTTLAPSNNLPDYQGGVLIDFEGGGGTSPGFAGE